MQTELTVAEKPDIMTSSRLTPAQEAREVIETETRCHQAPTPEPAFLIAMRSVLGLQKLREPFACLVATTICVFKTNAAVKLFCACWRLLSGMLSVWDTPKSSLELRLLLQVVEVMDCLLRVYSSR